MAKQQRFYYVSGPANGASHVFASDVGLVHVDMDTGAAADPASSVAAFVAVYKRVGNLLVFMGAKERS